MKKVFCLFPALMFLFILGCRTVEERNVEPVGRVVIYTSLYQYAIEAVWMDMQRHFPDVVIEFVYGGTGVIQEKVRQERASGRLGADILMVAGPAYSLELKELGMLHPFISREIANLAFDYDPDGYWYPVRVSNMVLAFNPQRFARDTVPGSFYDFANETSLRGAVSMRNPLVSGTIFAAIAALRDKYGQPYFEALGNQRVMIDYGADDTLGKLERGETRAAMVLEESILRSRQLFNSPLEVIYPADGTVVIPSTVMIINDSWSANRNAHAAEAVADWFLSREGQNAIVDGWMHSVRSDFRRIPNGSIPMTRILSNSMPVNWENVFRERQDIQTMFETYAAARR